MSDEFFDTIFFVEGFVFGGGKGDIKVGARTVHMYIGYQSNGTVHTAHVEGGFFPPGSGHLFSAYEL